MNKKENFILNQESRPQEHVHTIESKTAVVNRLAKAIGHLESVKKMVENDRDTTEILVQLAAVRAAINNTGKIILQDHIDNCVSDLLENGNREAIKDLEEAINRFIK